MRPLPLVLTPKWRTARARFRQGQSRGKVLTIGIVGALSLLADFVVLYRVLSYCRGVEEIGPLLAS